MKIAPQVIDSLAPSGVLRASIRSWAEMPALWMRSNALMPSHSAGAAKPSVTGINPMTSAAQPRARLSRTGATGRQRRPGLRQQHPAQHPGRRRAEARRDDGVRGGDVPQAHVVAGAREREPE